MTNMTGSKLSIFSHPGQITDYWITTRSFPYRSPYWPGPIWASTSSQANMEMPMYYSVIIIIIIIIIIILFLLQLLFKLMKS